MKKVLILSSAHSYISQLSKSNLSCSQCLLYSSKDEVCYFSIELYCLKISRTWRMFPWKLSASKRTLFPVYQQLNSELQVPELTFAVAKILVFLSSIWLFLYCEMLSTFDFLTALNLCITLTLSNHSCYSAATLKQTCSQNALFYQKYC